ncbi:immunoglobulin-like domain-containing protein [Lachnospiraceae bacterium C1.1]|nr:type II secretion system F family protein [Lachnospiraceae bacterium C1.1]
MQIVIINILMLIAFCMVFIVSRNTETEKKGSRIELIFYRAAAYIDKFKAPTVSRDMLRQQKLLHPTGKAGDLVRDYRIKKISEFLIIIFAGNILALILALNSGDAGKAVESLEFKRNSFGEGVRTESLDIFVDGKTAEKNSEIEISERRYDPEELKKAFQELKKILPEIIVGENESLKKVDHDLSLPLKYENYPIEISWYSSDYNIMDSYGVIDEDFFEKDGAEIELTAALDYYGEHDELVIPLKVYPREMSPEEALKAAVKRAIKANDMAGISSDSIVLPDEVEGKSVSYSHPESNAGMTVFILGIVAAFVIFHLRDDEVKKAVEKRDALMSEDYPEIVSRLTLLLSAGMTIRGAFEKTALDYEKDKVRGKCPERYAYEEMLVAVRQMKSGKSEMAAYQDFGSRSASPRFNKLGSLLSQNLKKGSSGLLNILEYETKDAFEDRKAIARRKGEEAGTRLLLPMGMMLMIVLVVVVVPSIITFA